MSPDMIFSTTNLIVLPGWLLLLFLPRWKHTPTLVTALIIPLFLAAVYSILIVTRFGGSQGGFGSLADVSLLFRDPYLLLAGWIHYLAFDLFIGAWEVREARRLGIGHLFVVPCLVVTFLFGPAGLLLFFIVRLTVAKRLQLGMES